MSQLEVLKSDLSAKFGEGVFQFSKTAAGDQVIEASKENIPALLKYLKDCS